MPDKPRDDAAHRPDTPAGAVQSQPQYALIEADDNELGPIGCRILSSSALLANLTELNLSNNKIKDVGVKALANADLQFIEDLSLSCTSTIQTIMPSHPRA